MTDECILYKQYTIYDVSMNPYEVLKLPTTATLEDVRTRYKELARENHPDKLYGVSSEEKKKKEEYFKQVTVAYQILIERLKNGNVRNCATETESDTDIWKRMWAEIEKKDIWSFMNDIFKDVSTKYVSKKTHNIKFEVTLEDICCKRDKKLRLFLQGVVEPVFITVCAAKYPIFEHIYTAKDTSIHIIKVHIVPKEHDTYVLDDDGTIRCSFPLTIQEYMFGTSLDIPCCDGTVYPYTLPPFSDLDDHIVVPKKGIRHECDMIVDFVMIPPSEYQWNVLEPAEQDILKRLVNKMYEDKRI